jgi:pimeloyl-ACP methyl ester carboxylesterase
METSITSSVFLDDIKIVYKSYGSGTDALVFVHGWSCDSSLWSLQAPLFERYHSLLIDLPGHGGSDSPHIEYTQELFANAIEAVLQQEAITRAVMIAHSMGGPVATMFLRLFTNRVSAIIYVDSFFRLPEDYYPHVRRRACVQELADDEKFQTILEYFWTPRTTQDIRNQVKKIMMDTAKHVRVSALTTPLMPHAFRWDEIFHIPALLLVTPPFSNYDRHWIHHLPELEVKYWEDNGHFLFLEAPDRFNEEVQGFLAQHSLLEKKLE